MPEPQRKSSLATASTPVATPKSQKLKGRLVKPESRQVPVLKAQSGGMSLNDLRACRNALKKLKSNKHALLFNQPVDPIRDHAPKYVTCLDLVMMSLTFVATSTLLKSQWI